MHIPTSAALGNVMTGTGAILLALACATTGKAAHAYSDTQLNP